MHTLLPLLMDWQLADINPSGFRKGLETIWKNESSCFFLFYLFQINAMTGTNKTFLPMCNNVDFGSDISRNKFLRVGRKCF